MLLPTERTNDDYEYCDYDYDDLQRIPLESEWNKQHGRFEEDRGRLSERNHAMPTGRDRVPHCIVPAERTWHADCIHDGSKPKNEVEGRQPCRRIPAASLGSQWDWCEALYEEQSGAELGARWHDGLARFPLDE